MSDNTDVTPPLGALLVSLAEAPETAGKFESWAGEGANEPLTGDEIAAQMAPETLTSLAEKAGATEAEVAATLAQEIPALVDAIPTQTIQKFRSISATSTAGQGRVQDTDFAAETAQ